MSGYQVVESAERAECIPLLRYGLDVFDDVRVAWEHGAELIAVDGREPAERAGRLVDLQCERFAQIPTSPDSGALWAVIDRARLSTARPPVAYLPGHTVVDRRPWSGHVASDPHAREPAWVAVALAVEAVPSAGLWSQTMSSATR